jgi:hypothetical protein
MCTTCDDTQIPVVTKPCSYTGAPIDCIGIKTGDSYEVAFQKLSEYVCNLDLFPTSNKLVYYSETALGPNTPGTYPTYSILSNTTYIIPNGGDGEYEVVYTGNIVFPYDTNELDISLFINGVEHSALARKTITSITSGITPITFFISNLTLVAGDIVTMRCTSLKKDVMYPENFVLKISKIS